MKALLLFFVLVCALSARAEVFRCEDFFAQKSTSPIEDALKQTFAEAFRSKKVYRCLECHLNVMRFFDLLRANYPSYDFSEIKVLYIAHQKMPFDSSEDVGFHIKGARGSVQQDRANEFVFWNFHVVIEFRGKIYDFDFTDSPTPLSLRDYIGEFFMTSKEISELAQAYGVELEGSTSELIVYALPGTEYFAYNHHQVNTWDFHLALFASDSAVPLLSYINPN